MGSGAAVEQARMSLHLVALQPTMGALARDPHRLRDMRHSLTLPSDPLDQQTPAMHGETSITVSHEDSGCENGYLHNTWRSSLTSSRHQRHAGYI